MPSETRLLSLGETRSHTRCSPEHGPGAGRRPGAPVGGRQRRGSRRSRFRRTVLVLGPGTIGQAIARGANWRGAARIVVVGLNDAARLATACHIGATEHTIDLATSGPLHEASIPRAHRRPPGRRGVRGDRASVQHRRRPEGAASGRHPGGHRHPRGAVGAGRHEAGAHRQQIRGAHGSRRRGWERMAQRTVLHSRRCAPSSPCSWAWPMRCMDSSARRPATSLRWSCCPRAARERAGPRPAGARERTRPADAGPARRPRRD